MKRKAALALIAAMAFSAAVAQELVIGEKVPVYKVKEWIDMRRPMSVPHKMMLIEFFHSANKESVKRLGELNALAKEYASGLVVVVITKEEISEVVPMLKKASSLYYIGIDDGGKTFSTFGVHYVPYAVLIDPKERLLWIGNSTTMGKEVIENNLEHGIYKDRSLRRSSSATKR